MQCRPDCFSGDCSQCLYLARIVGTRSANAIRHLEKEVSGWSDEQLVEAIKTREMKIEVLRAEMELLRDTFFENKVPIPI